MTLENLKNLERIGQLKAEPFDKQEFDRLVDAADNRLHDVINSSLSQASRFDLTYNAAHASEPTNVQKISRIIDSSVSAQH